jgi:thiol-disulfide isomerase/thioredoxin
MRIASILLLVLVLGSFGYAYYKDPAGCQKLASDIASDTVAIVGTIKPPYFTPASGSTQPAATSASASNGVEYPMGYVAKTPAPGSEPSSVPAPESAPTMATPVPAITPAAASPGASYGSFTNYDEALDAARKANVPMLILFTGSDWCPYCQKLEQEVLSTSDFTKYVSSHYVFLTIDDLRNTPVPDTLETKIKQLEQKYNVTGFPTLMVVTDDEKEKGREEGYDPGSGPVSVIGQLNQIAAK